VRVVQDRVVDIGEKRLIRQVLADYATTARREHIDDCIVIDLSELAGVPGLPYLVYSIDHPGRIDRPVDPGMEWRFRGRWAAACTCNDVLAMGARPRGFALDLAMPGDLPVNAIRGFYEGVRDVLGVYGTALDGGNSDANTRFESAAMSWGTVARDGIVRRSGARPGDYVAVTTEPGLGWAAYLLRRQGRFGELPTAARQELDRYNLFPLAPHRSILRTVQRLPGALTSGMDLTDGLAEFVYTIQETTGLGVRVDADELPVSPTLEACAHLLGTPPSLLALEYGYDTPRIHGYTIDPARWAAVQEIFAGHGDPLYRIGEVTTDPAVCWHSKEHGTTGIPRLWHDQFQDGDIVQHWRDSVAQLAALSTSD